MLKLKPELIKNLDTPEGLRNALQQAIELEHSTIPTYLYAYFSLRFAPGYSEAGTSTNYYINEAIWTIVYEEMLHMGLACNLLNAIGGQPRINKRGFIPKYPGPLPGGVDKGLIVPLAPFSRELVHDVFMEIEEPEQPIDPSVDAKSILAAKPGHITIGQFYHAIAVELKRQAKSIFVGRHDLQVDLSQTFSDENTRPTSASGSDSKPGADGLIPKAVTNIDSALAAINLIVDQGEGSSKSPLNPEGQKAHYYRFAEIYHGKQLIEDPANPGEWIYGGPPIYFDPSPSGVVPMIKNPKEADYPANSEAQGYCRVFNETYKLLLDYLHDTFNGKPGRLNTAIALMDSLYANASSLMSIQLKDGLYAGPSFEYRAIER
ncbi:MAG: ferritin-like protein [Chloroflexota bacterium]|nr:ferritin-like protein [Chloroflexota bacterium]